MTKGFKDKDGKFHPTKTGTGSADTMKLLGETSGKMGMKQGKDFAMHGGKAVSLKEKEQAIKLKEEKENELKKKQPNILTSPSKHKLEVAFNKDFKASRFNDADSPAKIQEVEKQSYLEGYDRGISFAEGASELLFDLRIGDDVTEKDLPIDPDEAGVKVIKTNKDLRDIVALSAFEAEENDRQFSPFEFTAKELRDREEVKVKADNVLGSIHADAFDAFQDGVDDGVGSYLELFYELNPKFKGKGK